MFKIANQILDVYDDLESRLHLAKVGRLDPKVTILSTQEHTALSDDDFALSVITKTASKLNKFPINSHDDVWLSNQYFDHTSHRLPKTAAETAAYHIKQACERFGIKPTPAVAALAKEASTNLYFEEDLPSRREVKTQHVSLEKFAEVEKIAENYTVAQYTFATPAHVKIASKYFEEHYQKMPLDIRHKYAAAIQMRAKELGLKPQGGCVAKYASDSYSAHLDAHLRKRASLLEVAAPEIRDGFNKVAAMKKEMEPMKFASLLHSFDKKAKLDKYYGGYLINPYEATFAVQPDEYAAYRYKTASANLGADDIKKLAVEKYAKIKEYFGSHLADELKKDSIPIFESLPMDAKEILVGISNGSL